MPEISGFFGIVVQMYVDDHLPPHFHARHAGSEAVIAIGSHQVIAGRLSPRALALVIEWAAIHVDDLRLNWQRAQARLPLVKIPPLR